MNLFADVPPTLPEEWQETLLAGQGRFRLERIVSYGHASPPGFWYEQEEDEWVALLSGSACLAFDDGREQRLQAGDYLLLPAGCRHRVAWTAPDADTVWLALFTAAAAPEPAASQQICWQRLDTPGLEEVRLWLGEGLAFRAAGSLLHAAGGISLRYEMQIGSDGLLRSALIETLAPQSYRLQLAQSRSGHWLRNGQPAPEWDGITELDLECCGLTNALPIRRLQLAVGASDSLPVLFVRLPELLPTITTQHYSRLADVADQACYDYRCRDYQSQISVDSAGFTENYRGFLQRIRP